MLTHTWEILAALIAAHFYFDYPGQGEFIAKAKSRIIPVPGIPFWQPLTAHAALHGVAAGLITGLWWVCIAETGIHWITDDAKCRGKSATPAIKLSTLRVSSGGLRGGSY